MFKNYFTFILLICINFNLYAKHNIKKVYATKRLETSKPIIDGKLDDDCWKTANWASGFVQYEPLEGKAPSQKTQFAIYYDDQNLYVAIKAYDSSIDSIVHRMTVKDDIDGDWVCIQLDSYHDQRTAFCFSASAAGVKSDYMMTNDGNSQDYNWNPIWWLKTSTASDGWYAEMKIPLNQLRFSDSPNQIWGIQINRKLFRKNELSIWQPIARNASGWVSDIGELHGLKNIKARKIFDLTPFVAAKADSYQKEAENPFASGKDYNLNAGLDGKIGITNNLTLDFTVNPDFGQVEADPSQVNLTAYETFYSEKRPFFIEGRNILSFPLMFGDGDLASQNLFYSRRIGRRPHYSPQLKEGEYSKIPDFTSILGAAKITGKTANGWSIGLMESLGAEENAKISDGTNMRKEIVEPMTNYSVLRLQKDHNDGNTLFGTMLTSTNRRLNSPNLQYLHKNAYSGGTDFTQYFKDKTWFVKVNGMFSHVEGDSTAILLTQTSSARYFQRPDAGYLRVDSSLTQMTGSAGNVQFGKIGGGNLMFLTALSFKSPSFEINDIGFLPQSDDITEIIWMGYNFYKPFSIFRSLGINMNQWSGWNFGGINTFNGGNINVNTELTNYWNFGMGINVQSNQISDGTLRGGPSIKLPGNVNSWFWLGTNNQKKIRLSINGRVSRGFENISSNQSINLGLSYQPTSTLKVSFSPEYSNRITKLQYIGEYSYKDEPRYIMASIQQNTWSMSVRINYNITPDLSIQYWGQPFIAAGKYSDFKKITNPLVDKFEQRFHTFTSSEITYDSDKHSYNIDEAQNGSNVYAVYNPDFNYKEFLSNLVIRWEYIPGSTVYLVWSQTRDNFIDNGNFQLYNDTRQLFNRVPHDIFMLKLSYRIGL